MIFQEDVQHLPSGGSGADPEKKSEIRVTLRYQKSHAEHDVACLLYNTQRKTSEPSSSSMRRGSLSLVSWLSLQ